MMREFVQQFVEQLAAAVEAEAQRRAEQLFRERVSSLLNTDVRGAGPVAPASAVPEPAVPAKQGSTFLGGEVAHSATKQTPLSTSMVPSRPNGDSGRAAAPARTDGERKRKPNTCSKCGAVGFTAQSCGRTHNVSTSPAVATSAIPRPSSEASPPATSPIKLVDRTPPPTSSGSDRIAAIAASAKRVDVRSSGGHPRGASRAVGPLSEVPLTDDERDALRESGLPRAVSSFTF